MRGDYVHQTSIFNKFHYIFRDNDLFVLSIRNIFKYKTLQKNGYAHSLYLFFNHRDNLFYNFVFYDAFYTCIGVNV